jgi:uncharacterized protein
MLCLTNNHTQAAPVIKPKISVQEGMGSISKDTKTSARGMSPSLRIIPIAPYNQSAMTIAERVQKDMIEAMKAKDESRLGTIRLMKTAIKNKEIDKRAPLDDQEAIAVLSTMIKQRKESIEQFTKGGRPELAAREAAEIELIETYMPKAASAEDIAGAVKATISEMGSPSMKDMGNVMKAVMAKFAATGTRVDGKQVNEAVRKALTQ